MTTIQSIPTMNKPLSFPYGVFCSRKVKSNEKLVNLLGPQFEHSSFVRASESADNYSYVTWQIQRNRSHARFVKQIGNLSLFQVLQSNRYYLISETGSAISIEYRSK